MALIATCHCGSVRISVPTPPVSVTACNCTFCSKRGALWAYYPPSEVTLEREDAEAVYAPSVVNKHHFCAVCGCTTYSLTPDWSTGEAQEGVMRLAVNARLFDDFDLPAVPVEQLDGRSGW